MIFPLSCLIENLYPRHTGLLRMLGKLFPTFENVSDVVVHMEPFSKESEFSTMTSDARREHLLATRCEREIRNDVADAALATKGVQGVSPVAVHYRDMGIFVDVNIYVHSELRVGEAHKVARRSVRIQHFI